MNKARIEENKYYAYKWVLSYTAIAQFRTYRWPDSLYDFLIRALFLLEVTSSMLKMCMSIAVSAPQGIGSATNGLVLPKLSTRTERQSFIAWLNVFRHQNNGRGYFTLWSTWPHTLQPRQQEWLTELHRLFLETSHQNIRLCLKCLESSHGYLSRKGLCYGMTWSIELHWYVGDISVFRSPSRLWIMPSGELITMKLFTNADDMRYKFLHTDVKMSGLG